MPRSPPAAVPKARQAPSGRPPSRRFLGVRRAPGGTFEPCREACSPRSLRMVLLTGKGVVVQQLRIALVRRLVEGHQVLEIVRTTAAQGTYVMKRYGLSIGADGRQTLAHP